MPLILDASQAAGAVPIRVDELGCAFVGMPGHKGLYGPPGNRTSVGGSGAGNGTPDGRWYGKPVHPAGYAELSSGSSGGRDPQYTGIAGLLEGIRYIQAQGEGRILHHEQELTALAAGKLSRVPGVTVYAAHHPGMQSGVLSFVMEGIDCEEIGERLGEQDIAVRAGLHCAPCAHETVGTLGSGTVRVSFSAFNTPAEVIKLISAVSEIKR